nr:pepsin A (EC 3.4.23.1) precursor - Mongolian sheep (fragments) [Ovis aries platyura]
SVFKIPLVKKKSLRQVSDQPLQNYLDTE